ncbi:MAG: hypothetical protein HY650_10260 [Acidobacteria bacterium]|nr:hypothetical protein [Acidobacteriota bacterium]
MIKTGQSIMILTALLLLGQPATYSGSSFHANLLRSLSGREAAQGPPAGTDFVDAGAYIELELNLPGPPAGAQNLSGLPTITSNVYLQGNSKLRRSARMGNVIPTELMTLSLAGLFPSPAGPSYIQLRVNPDRISTGMMTLGPGMGGTWAVDSFFDIFTEWDGFARKSNSAPLRLAGPFREIPLCRETCSTPTQYPPVSLFNVQGQAVGRIMRMEVFLCQPMVFSLAPGNPSGLDPADILSPGPPVGVYLRKEQLGLRAGDDIKALSNGMDFLYERQRTFPRFSVDAASRGVLDSAVRKESTVTPAEAHGDEFGLKPFGPNDNPCVGGAANFLCYDENGVPGSLTATPIGLRVCDDMDALMEIIPGHLTPVFFTLAPGSPTLAMLGATPADILVAVPDGPPSIFARAAQLGLRPGDSIDALCLMENGDRRYSSASDPLHFSLAPGSPTLGTIILSFSAADVLRPGPPVSVVASAESLGLLRTDNLDALKCRAYP